MEVKLGTGRPFPAGTEVKVYPESDWPDPSGKPVTKKKVTKAGDLTVAKLDEGKRYVAVAEVGGRERTVTFTAKKGS